MRSLPKVIPGPVCFVLALASLVLFIAISDGGATGGYRDSWLATYPGACQTLRSAASTCVLCHTSPPDLNPYGSAVQGNRTNLVATNDDDPDDDTFTNIQEINNCTLPGDAASHPVPIGESTWGLIKALFR